MQKAAFKRVGRYRYRKQKSREKFCIFDSNAEITTAGHRVREKAALHSAGTIQRDIDVSQHVLSFSAKMLHIFSEKLSIMIC